jgi:uncharacterized membrane protein
MAAAPIVIALLTFLHVGFAIAWFGGLMYFVSAVGPGVRKFTPPASLEFLAKVGPRQLRFFMLAATGTIVFGLGLLFAAFGTDYPAWPGYIEIGFTLGLIAFLIAALVTFPSFLKVDKIVKGMASDPRGGPPPPELARYLKRGSLGTMIVTVILLLTLVFMVGSAVFA